MKRSIKSSRYLRGNTNESKFDRWQMKAIWEGMESGVDVEIYADPKFDSAQMEQIRLGLESGVDVSVYADPKFNNVEMEEIRYGLESGVDADIVLRKVVSKSRPPKWSSILSKLEQDYENGLDPFYDQTDAGSYIEGLCRDVEHKLGYFFEPSVQGGVGGIWIYDDNNDNEVIVSGYDYQTYNDEVADIAIESKNMTDFKRKYKDYLLSICE